MRIKLTQKTEAGWGKRIRERMIFPLEFSSFQNENGHSRTSQSWKSIHSDFLLLNLVAIESVPVATKSNFYIQMYRRISHDILMIMISNEMDLEKKNGKIIDYTEKKNMVRALHDDQRLNHQGNITLLNIYAANRGASKYINKTKQELKGERNTHYS